jgi:hypothetical protein
MAAYTYMYKHMYIRAYVCIDILQSRPNMSMPAGTYNQVGTYARAYMAGGTYTGGGIPQIPARARPGVTALGVAYELKSSQMQPIMVV